MRVRRAVTGVLAGVALVLAGAGSCDGGPGVPQEGERGDGFGSGTAQDPEDTAGEGGAGDEVGGGG